MVICQDCGKEVPKDKFCKNCGAYLGNVEEVPVIEKTEVPEVSEETAVPVPIESDNVNFCHKCGSKITGNFKFCPNCGQELNAKVSKSPKTVASSEKNILLAIILSVILPGLGQIYLGLDRKGAIFLISDQSFHSIDIWLSLICSCGSIYRSQSFKKILELFV